MAKQINPGQMIIYATSLLTIFSVLFAGIFGRLDTLLLGLGIALVSYSMEQPLPMTLLVSSLAVFLASYLPFGKTSSYLIQGFAAEGFENGEGEGFDSDDDDKRRENGEGFDDGDEGFDEGDEGFDEGERREGEPEGFGEYDSEGKRREGEPEGFSGGGDEGFDSESSDEDEGFVTAEFSSKNTMEGFANEEKKKKKRRPPPDNGTRPAEMFELGKKYTMPKETDDPEFHLDAGTTFLNAYKSLNPDQISAMTKDTQDLINTQKQLMSTLNTLKPLITDGKQMMDTFQNYFGAAAGGEVGDLAKMAEKFAPK